MLVDVAGVTRRGALVTGNLAAPPASIAVTTASPPWWLAQTTSPRSRDGTEYLPPSKGDHRGIGPDRAGHTSTAV